MGKRKVKENQREFRVMKSNVRRKDKLFQKKRLKKVNNREKVNY